MIWKKKGLIYSPSRDINDWRYSSALTPTPFLLNEETIRVYFGARDKEGVSRIAYADLDSRDPSRILKISSTPVLDIGEPGCFDDNGIILGDVVAFGNEIRMYYVGFQKPEKAKFFAFTGLAISTDQGETFQKVTKAPILDRSEEGLFFRAIHTALYEDNVWKVWYGVGSKWTSINGLPFPNYDIRYIESPDGISFSSQGQECIQQQGDEYRIGRPRIYKTEKGYIAFYTKGCIKGTYLPGVAFSQDGINWKRDDEKIGISLSEEGWDSKTICYTSMLKVKDDVYLFYNGNNMGEEGFGYAVLEKQ